MLSATGETKRGLREADREGRKDGGKEKRERESVSRHKHTKYVGFSTEEAGLGQCMIC